MTARKKKVILKVISQRAPDYRADFRVKPVLGWRLRTVPKIHRHRSPNFPKLQHQILVSPSTRRTRERDFMASDLLMLWEYEEE